LVNSICGELNVGGPASNQHDSNPATVTPLLRCLSTKHNLIDLAKKAFSSYKRIEEHKQESINTQSEIADMNDANIQMRVQELGSKRLINTVEQIKNGVLDHCKRICHHSYDERFSFSMEN